MKYPKYTDYEEMYKRYFSKGVDYLIKNASLKSDDNVLDICGGNGRLSKELIKKCSNVSYLDKEKDMIPSKLSEVGIIVYNDTVENFIKRTSEKYTKVFCEQAINYWLLNIDIEQFSKIFEKDALFIFNTFSCEPSKTPMIKEYSIEGIQYMEISYLLGNKVEHIQVCEGYQPHITEFDWIPEDQFKKLLSPYFDITLKDDGKSALYVCKRR